MNVQLLPVNVISKKVTGNDYPGKPITEIIPNGFFTVDRKWTVKYWNKAAERMLKVSSNDIVGKNLWEEFAGVIPLEFYALYHKAFLYDIPVHFEEYWGEMGCWFDVITYYSDDTLSVSFKCSSQLPVPDKAELEVSEPPFKILNQLYRFVTEVTNDCLWEWDIVGEDIFWIDGGHKRLFGYDIVNALIPQSFWKNCIHPDDRERILEGIKKIIAEGSNVWEDEYRFKKSDGGYAHVHDRGHIIYDDQNRVSRMIGATQDITRRKLTELHLLESEKKLSLIARQTVNALIITDAEGKISWVNNAFTHITEYEPDEVMGKKPGSFLQGEETDPLTVDYLRKQVKDKLPFRCDIINYTKSGRKYWMHVQGQPLFNEKGNCEQYFAIETDITEKIIQEKKITQERFSRQSEITDAVLTALENERSHIGKEMHDNLGQILALAKLYIQMAKKYDNKRELYLDKSCDFIMEVIEEIRKIAKTLVTPGTHGIGLFDHISNVLQDILLVHPIKIEFNEENIREEDLNEKLQITIFRIIQEQLNNVLKHSKATKAVIDLGRVEDRIILTISDNGQGSDPANNKNGVGIINIKSRAELYGGIATIISNPGEGFQLKVELPLNRFG
ncbi:MAG: PAS domain S-box protein [Chitinophagaceae bacterium]